MIRKLRNWEQTKISGRVLLSLNLRLYLEISQDFEDPITVYLVINGIYMLTVMRGLNPWQVRYIIRDVDTYTESFHRNASY